MIGGALLVLRCCFKNLSATCQLCVVVSKRSSAGPGQLIVWQWKNPEECYGQICNY